MKNRNLSTATLISILFYGAFSPSASFAASQAECAIWLCLPGGFPAGCAAAHAAMIDRIKDFKPPLPPFASCAVDDGSNVNTSIDFSTAALIEEHPECSRYQPWDRDFTDCAKWEWVPRKFVKKTRCLIGPEGANEPPHCIGTYYYVDVFIDGDLIGETYYWRR